MITDAALLAAQAALALYEQAEADAVKWRHHAEAVEDRLAAVERVCNIFAMDMYHCGATLNDQPEHVVLVGDIRVALASGFPR